MAKRTRAEQRRRRHQRLRFKLTGTPERPRLNIYRSLSGIYAQVIDDYAGRTLAQASTIDSKLRPEMTGKTATEQAKLVGKMIAERAQQAGVTTVVFDRGGYKYHGRVKALAEAAREAGLQF